MASRMAGDRVRGGVARAARGALPGARRRAEAPTRSRSGARHAVRRCRSPSRTSARVSRPTFGSLRASSPAATDAQPASGRTARTRPRASVDRLPGRAPLCRRRLARKGRSTARPHGQAAPCWGHDGSGRAHSVARPARRSMSCRRRPTRAPASGAARHLQPRVLPRLDRDLPFGTFPSVGTFPLVPETTTAWRTRRTGAAGRWHAAEAAARRRESGRPAGGRKGRRAHDVTTTQERTRVCAASSVLPVLRTPDASRSDGGRARAPRPGRRRLLRAAAGQPGSPAPQHHRPRRRPPAGRQRGRDHLARLQRRDLQLPRAARRARGRGHTFRTSSDSEVIVHAYEEWGPACAARFNGMWAFAVADLRGAGADGRAASSS